MVKPITVQSSTRTVEERDQDTSPFFGVQEPVHVLRLRDLEYQRVHKSTMLGRGLCTELSTPGLAVP
jgi:hypothetical protein